VTSEPHTDYPPATERFLAAAREAGVDVKPSVYPDGTKTSQDAADAIGCPLSAIAKSLVFMVDDEATLVMMSGDLRVDMDKLVDVAGASAARRANLDEVRTHTGYVAGGTPAFGHAGAMRVYADISLRRNDPVWSAAGTPTTVYPIPLDTLMTAAGAEWVDVAEAQ